MNDKHIGIFDSGVGAFSVLNKLVEVLPNENYIYFGDSGHNPYGQKTAGQIRTLSKCIIDFLIKKDVKMIVIACNTATIAALDELQKIYDIDIVGVINPGAKEALKVTKNGKIGVCSTVFTAKSHGYLNEINKLKDKRSITVYEEGSKNLANIVENGFKYNQENENLIKEFVGRFKDDIDTLVFGCTHYPFVEDLFKKYFKGNIVDPGMQTALEVKEILEKKNMLNKSNQKAKVKYFVTKNADDFKKVAQNLTKLEISDINSVSIEDELKVQGFFESWIDKVIIINFSNYILKV